MSRVMHLYRRTSMRGRGGPMGDPTRGRGRILALLKIQDGISTKDLSYLLGIRVTSLNELLAKLEKSGHIVREPSPEDRRVMLIKLTDAGREASDADSGDDVLSVLSAQEQEDLEKILDKLLEALEAKAEEDMAQRNEWAEKLRERMGDEDFAAWMEEIGTKMGDRRMARFARMFDEEPDKRHKRHGKGRKHARPEGRFDGPPGFPLGPPRGGPDGFPPPPFAGPEGFCSPRGRR
jgi:DNA-binding MarR family transcriptional regulator